MNDRERNWMCKYDKIMQYGWQRIENGTENVGYFYTIIL